MNAAIATEYQTAADFIPTTTSAYRLGVLSAQLDEICVPEAVFLFRHDIREFCRGYASVKGATITTVQILGEVQQ